jgi:hypothetical protein
MVLLVLRYVLHAFTRHPTIFTIQLATFSSATGDIIATPMPSTVYSIHSQTIRPALILPV